MAKVKRKFWTDHEGRRWQVPNIKDRLRTHQIAGHAALKAFVICRDGGKCGRCGSHEELLADHIVSKRNGGTHHPDNLQCLCKPCNDRKSNFEDRGKHPPGEMLERAGIKDRPGYDIGPTTFDEKTQMFSTTVTVRPSLILEQQTHANKSTCRCAKCSQ